MSYKLAILLSHPIQYHAPIFRALAAAPDIDLTVYYGCDHGVTERFDPEFGLRFKWDIPLLDGYRSVFLPNYSRRPRPTFWGQITPSIIKALARENFDAILVHGYVSLAAWFAFLGGGLTRTPLLLRGITHLLDERPTRIRLLKRLVLTPLFRRCAACLYIGEHNRRYYQQYGVAESKLFHVPHVVDNAFFQAHYHALRPQKQALRQQFGIANDAPVILLPAKLIPIKQPLLLLDIFREVCHQLPCNLLFVGEGALRSQIQAAISEWAVPNVYLTGFLNQNEMPKAYMAADVMALPSISETWGLVVNEAMNFELPIIISNKVGCGPDLVRHGENGYIIDSPAGLREALLSLVADPEKRRRFGRRSGEIINEWGVPECVAGIRRALEAVAGRDPSLQHDMERGSHEGR